MLLKEIINALNDSVPFPLQEDYDNSGLIIGNGADNIHSVLITLDITHEVMDEAARKGCNLIISHHPLIFSGLKSLTGQTETEKLVARAIREGIAVAAMHTNADNHHMGVNKILCNKLGVENHKVLKPLKGTLRKLATFVPKSHTDGVLNALFEAGAGKIGNYDSCSYRISGTGTFRALDHANPFVGKIGELHQEPEEKIELVFPEFLEKKVISALLESHPYEEVAYDIYTLANSWNRAGAGMIGELRTPEYADVFLSKVKALLNLGCVRHTGEKNELIKRVAVCGGSGSFLIKDALKAGADIFLTGDIKYHDFFLPSGKMIIADIGHYESEQYTKELIFTLLREKFPTFALFISETITNPIKYL